MKSNNKRRTYEVMDSKEERTLVIESDYVDYCEADICATVKEADGTWGPYADFDGCVDGAEVIEWALSKGFEMTEFAAEVVTFVVDAALIVRDMTIAEAVSHKLSDTGREWEYDADQMIHVADDGAWLEWECNEHGTFLYSLHSEDNGQKAVWEFHSDSIGQAISRANGILGNIHHRWRYESEGE